MGAAASPWRSVESLPGGDVHVTAVPVLDQDLSLGFVVLVQDLSFVERREATTRWFLLVGFGFLALAASVVTVLAARLSWRGWSSDLRKLLRGGSQPVEFQPIMRDVREARAFERGHRVLAVGRGRIEDIAGNRRLLDALRDDHRDLAAVSLINMVSDVFGPCGDDSAFGNGITVGL